MTDAGDTSRQPSKAKQLPIRHTLEDPSISQLTASVNEQLDTQVTLQQPSIMTRNNKSGLDRGGVRPSDLNKSMYSKSPRFKQINAATTATLNESRKSIFTAMRSTDFGSKGMYKPTTTFGGKVASLRSWVENVDKTQSEEWK